MEILDLPTEVMILIFKLLTPADRRSAVTVCHKWLDLMNGFFGEDHSLVLTSDLDYTANGSLYQTFANRSTKHLKVSHLVIDDVNVSKLTEMRNLIELFGDEVKFLKLKHIWLDPKVEEEAVYALDQNLFAKIPNLKNLELMRANVLRDGCNDATELKYLNNYRKIKGLESLTVPWIKMGGREMGYKSLLPFLEEHTKVLLSQLIADNRRYVQIEAPTFNFCGEAKLTLDDISGIRIENNAKLFTEILSQFPNLKRLEYVQNNDCPLVLPKNRITYSVTEFELSVFTSTPPPPYFDMLLQSFPDLESLRIRDFWLDNEHLAIICQYMPKLKKLVLRLEASPETDGPYSLKDLRFLESLDIKTESHRNSGQWPHLPNLTELSLRGNGFRHLNRDFYSQIAQKSPKITNVTIDYKRGFKLHDFLPLMSQLKLTHLDLGCERNTGFNSGLVSNLIEHCQELKEVTIPDPIELSLSNELDLFSNIPSLMEVNHTNRSGELHRIMYRKDVENLKRYLSENLSLYKNLRRTVDYVAKHVIPPNEYQEMRQSFEEFYDTKRDLCIVTQAFLEMNPNSLCDLLDTLMYNYEYDPLNPESDYESD